MTGEREREKEGEKYRPHGKFEYFSSLAKMLTNSHSVCSSALAFDINIVHS